jgi:hypothetical protein
MRPSKQARQSIPPFGAMPDAAHSSSLTAGFVPKAQARRAILSLKLPSGRPQAAQAERLFFDFSRLPKRREKCSALRVTLLALSG